MKRTAIYVEVKNKAGGKFKYIRVKTIFLKGHWSVESIKNFLNRTEFKNWERIKLIKFKDGEIVDAEYIEK